MWYILLNMDLFCGIWYTYSNFRNLSGKEMQMTMVDPDLFIVIVEYIIKYTWLLKVNSLLDTFLDHYLNSNVTGQICFFAKRLW
jgi:hypothetical protein